MKVVAAVLLVLALIAMFLFLLVVLRRKLIQKSRASARWEPCTRLDGSVGKAIVTVDKIARWGGGSRVLESVYVASVSITDLGDPALLEVQAEATAKADTYNTLSSS